MTKKALIVDDDDTIRSLVCAILQASDFEVVQASNGKLAYDLLSGMPTPIELDLIVLDVMMPEMNGLETLTLIKNNPATKDIPVLMLTAEDQPEDILAGYSVGADYYITKPFTRQQLLYGIELILG